MEIRIPFDDSMHPSFSKKPSPYGSDEVEVTFRFHCGQKVAEDLGKIFDEAMDEIRCPSCHILWNQVFYEDYNKRHHADCKWPEILQQREEEEIFALEKLVELKKEKLRRTK